MCGEENDSTECGESSKLAGLYPSDRNPIACATAIRN